MSWVQRALLSVYDKTGVVDLARALVDHGAEILSTGGTSKLLESSGLEVSRVSDFTGEPEILGGRVKTLHPKIFGGILHRRKQEPEGLGQDLPPIDLIAVNLYPFQEKAEEFSRAGRNLPLTEELLEFIDIGGVSLLRAAAKNHARVLVLSEPDDYPEVMAHLKKGQAGPPLEVRRRLAAKAFQKVSAYDALIGQVLAGSKESLPDALSLGLQRLSLLRYGENPHQAGAWYRTEGPGLSLADGELLGGKELSYNNLLDLDAAVSLVRGFQKPSAAAIKHGNPCGAATAEGPTPAIRHALNCDPVSAYGGVVAVNRPLEEEGAKILAEGFLEVLAAPDFAPAALEVIRKKRNLRIFRLPGLADGPSGEERTELRSVLGGVLLQEGDRGDVDLKGAEIPTRQKSSPEALSLLEFVWQVSKHVKSNAIVLAARVPEGGMATIGIGAGQMSRVDAVALSIRKAQERHGRLLSGAALASDGFFPFRDGVDEAAKAGIKTIVQPGGSIRDEEVVRAADEAGIVMVLTRMRHFRH